MTLSTNTKIGICYTMGVISTVATIVMYYFGLDLLRSLISATQGIVFFVLPWIIKKQDEVTLQHEQIAESVKECNRMFDEITGKAHLHKIDITRIN
jgi:hypothetical protein